jgi:hypothetical protein
MLEIGGVLIKNRTFLHEFSDIQKGNKKDKKS